MMARAGHSPGLTAHACALVCAFLGCAEALAEKRVLRLAAVAPDGTLWAHELKDFARRVETETGGQLQVKLYLSAIAGSEAESEERIRRGQLDGVIAALICQRIAPSMRALRLLGMYQSLDEVSYVLQRLNPTMVDEAKKGGYALLGTAVLGPDVFFTRAPVRTLADLKRLKLWRWEGDQVVIDTSKEMGLPHLALPPERAARAFDDGKLDGFVAAPAAALAYQFLTRAPNLIDVRLGYVTGCMVVSQKTWEKLPPELQEKLHAEVQFTAGRLQTATQQIDQQLLGGELQKHGVQIQAGIDALKAELFAAARIARDKLDEQLVPAALRSRVDTLLADYRAERRAVPK
jgi:TRAP-type C4-dicarboxylate transport system substrate-binding protein